MESNDAEMDKEELKNQEVVEDAGIEYTENEELKGLDEGVEIEEFVQTTMQRLTSDDWKENFYGFDDLRRLYKFSDFEMYLPKFAELIVKGVENLRSSICRNSLLLVKEVFSETKDLSKADEDGNVTPYAEFVEKLIPVVSLVIANDKVFLSSLATEWIELIAKNWYSKNVTEALCELSRSKSIIIASEASKALTENCKITSTEFLESSDNVNVLLRTIWEDLTTKRQPFSKNAKLILKSFKDKMGDTKLKETAAEVLNDEDKVK